MNCEKVLASIDQYIDGELLTESSLDLNSHFEHCKHCSEEVAARREIRNRLQTAIRRESLPPGLEARISQKLRDAGKPAAKPKPFYLMAIAAALAVCFAYRLASPSGPALAAVMQVGVSDHIHCAVSRKVLNTASPVEKLPEKFRPLMPVVRQNVPAEYQLALAHECNFRSRQFVHMIFVDGDKRLSLVIAQKQDGESLQRAGVVTSVTSSGYQVAAFESRGYLVYTVSDLPPSKNANVLTALAPSISRFLDQMGA